MRRLTARAEQLKRTCATDDGRARAPAPWRKLPLFWFHLFLSYECTKQCAYCYSFNQVGHDCRLEMDEQTFCRLLEWIPEVWRANAVGVNAIGFLGGEPLLRTDRIRRVMDAVFTATGGMQGFVYTNGDLVDTVNWDDLEDIQWISTNITDTPLDEIARRMTLVRERSNVINQTVVATLDDFNLDRILDVSRFGIENGYRLRYYRNLYRGLDTEYRERLLRRYHEVCDVLEAYVDRGYDVRTTFLFDTLIPLWDEEGSPYPCGKRAAAVFPDGTIGPCLRNHGFKSGTIFDPDPLARLACDTFHYDAGRPDLDVECLACQSRTVCQGGCPNDRLQLTGTTRGKSVVCDIHREIIPRLRCLEQRKRERGSGSTGTATG
jgi:uncharacterized protein